VLLEVADGAKDVEDLFQRASVLTLCADALWDADEQAARSVFARAWEAAAESDEDDLKDERENGRHGDLPERFTPARDFVLAAAARRDTRMADSWLGALADWLSQQESDARDDAASEGGAAGTDIGPLNESTRDGKRLALASALMDDEAYDAAARVAAPAVQGGASGAVVEFLLTLRGRAPEEADRLYLQLLAAVRAGAAAGANDVLLLSSYVLTPRLLAGVRADGSLQYRPIGSSLHEGSTPRRAAEHAPDARVRAAFFDTAAAVLLRPAPDAGARAGEAAALYFAAGRLLPFFERESPQHAHALHARLAELAAAVDGARRASLDLQMQTQSLSPMNPTDPLAGLLETARRAGDPRLRDDVFLHVVHEAAKKRLWERARRLAEEIGDQGRRRDARVVIDSYQVASVGEGFSDKDDDYERAASLVRAAEVTPALRAYGFARAAEFASTRGKRARAAALLEEALDSASQADAGTSLRDAASMAAATVAARVGSPRAWDALAAAVAALNEDESFDGGRLWFNPEGRTSLSPGEADALDEAFRVFDVGRMFDAAARRDFDRAAAEARNLKSVSARSRALTAAARVALGRRADAGSTAAPSR
jgi:hypothetical protein